jgi:hypothetical protein
LLKLKAKYNSIYLVGYNECKSAAFRVSEREGVVKPREVRFTGNVSTENPEITYGVLEINDELWFKWFDGSKMLPQMSTCDKAAETLIKESGIYYGCPLCSFKTKSRDISKHHIDEHVNKFITQFTFELEEN